MPIFTIIAIVHIFYSTNFCERLCFTGRNGSVDSIVNKMCGWRAGNVLEQICFPPKNVLEFEIQLFVWTLSARLNVLYLAGLLWKDQHLTIHHSPIMCGKPLIMTMSRLDYCRDAWRKACTACSEHGLRQAGTVKLADNRCWQFIHDRISWMD